MQERMFWLASVALPGLGRPFWNSLEQVCSPVRGIAGRGALLRSGDVWASLRGQWRGGSPRRPDALTAFAVALAIAVEDDTQAALHAVDGIMCRRGAARAAPRGLRRRRCHGRPHGPELSKPPRAPGPQRRAASRGGDPGPARRGGLRESVFLRSPRPAARDPDVDHRGRLTDRRRGASLARSYRQVGGRGGHGQGRRTERAT